MRTFLIEPRDPLIARDGRPSALGQFESLPFPLPSTLAGAARTRMASADGVFNLMAAEARELERLAVHGPILARMAGDRVEDWLVPAPRDAVLFAAEDGSVVCQRLAPRAVAEGLHSDADGSGLQPLLFAGRSLTAAPKEKSLSRPPEFWSWTNFEEWLIDPADHSVFDLSKTVAGLPRERRAHLALQSGERVGEEGAVFETEGLRFLTPGNTALAAERLTSGRRFDDNGLRKPGNTALAAERLALSLRVDEDPAGLLVGKALTLRRELAPLGGERRLARWFESPDPWPEPPAGLFERIARERRARLILLSPAIFAQGSLPGWSSTPGLSGIKATVEAAAVGRATVVSGWDLRVGRPKATRRLAGAGSVFFVELQGNGSVEDWCRQTWLQPQSDALQDRHDGFGLAALGVWPEEAT